MSVDEIQKVINTWVDQVNDLKKEFDWIQIFENKGEIMGCSNLHPHGQVWAGNFVPNEILKEDVQQEKYFKRHNSERAYLKRLVHKEPRCTIAFGHCGQRGFVIPCDGRISKQQGNGICMEKITAGIGKVVSVAVGNERCVHCQIIFLKVLL